jgi:hypothetical protein
MSNLKNGVHIEEGQSSPGSDAHVLDVDIGTRAPDPDWIQGVLASVHEQFPDTIHEHNGVTNMLHVPLDLSGVHRSQRFFESVRRRIANLLRPHDVSGVRIGYHKAFHIIVRGPEKPWKTRPDYVL